MEYLKDFDDKLEDESFSDNELLSIAREYIEKLEERRYMLICVTDREICPLFFNTYKEAYDRMKYLFEQEMENSVDGNIGEFDAWVTDGSNHDDSDWKIVRLI